MLLPRVQAVCREAYAAAFGGEAPELALDYDDRFGDLALNAFHLAKTLRKAPPQIAAALAAEITARGAGVIEKAEPASGYVNLTLDPRFLFETAIGPALSAPGRFGEVALSSTRTIVEFSAPNTNKPQHLGHVRNDCLGDSVARILEASGRDVVRVNLINDRGIHICKSMLAYREFGEGVTPEQARVKGDHFVGGWYVRFEKLFAEEFAAHKAAHPADAEMDRDAFFKISRWGREAQTMLQRWEGGDPEVVALWRRMNDWVLAGFETTYADLGIRFDRVYFESDTYKLGKEIVQRGLADGIFEQRPDGAIEIDLEAENLGRKVVLRSDGTSVYITQDIATTAMKQEETGADEQIWVVGDEQIHHFKVLFAIIRRLGYPWADGLHHLAYGMVHLPEGKMKSREGTVVDADDLIAEVTALARQEIVAREPELAGAELEERSRSIGLAALKFMILSVTPQTTMTYDPKESVKFDGDTGPYVLYAYARIRRMLEDGGEDAGATGFDAALLGDPSERRLALKIAEFPEAVTRAARTLSPAVICTYLLQLARAYHSHNRQVPILKAEGAELRRARLALSRAAAIALARGLELLGIRTVDRM